MLALSVRRCICSGSEVDSRYVLTPARDQGSPAVTPYTPLPAAPSLASTQSTLRT